MPLTATRLDRGTTAPSLDRLRERYDASAHHWQDNLARLGQLHDYQLLFNSRMVNSHLQHLDATSKILDCGIGTGAFSLALTESIHYPVHVSGVDISYPMLTEAYRLLEHHTTSLDLRQGDVNRLPYADNTFDAVIYAHVLEHMANPMATLREMVRVLKPGAPLIGSVTRRGLGQKVMSLRWQHRGYAANQLDAFLQDIGLEAVRSFDYGTGWSRWMCLATLGVKPTLEC